MRRASDRFFFFFFSASAQEECCNNNNNTTAIKGVISFNCFQAQLSIVSSLPSTSSSSSENPLKHHHIFSYSMSPWETFSFSFAKKRWNGRETQSFPTHPLGLSNRPTGIMWQPCANSLKPQSSPPPPPLHFTLLCTTLSSTPPLLPPPGGGGGRRALSFFNTSSQQIVKKKLSKINLLFERRQSSFEEKTPVARIVSL